MDAKKTMGWDADGDYIYPETISDEELWKLAKWAVNSGDWAEFGAVKIISMGKTDATIRVHGGNWSDNFQVTKTRFLELVREKGGGFILGSSLPIFKADR